MAFRSDVTLEFMGQLEGSGAIMWVANICFEVKRGVDKTFVRAGKLWHNGQCGFVKMYLFSETAAGPHGKKYFGNAFKDIEPPYIGGDLTVRGGFLPDSSLREEFKVGWMYTESNGHGFVQYIIVLYADPWPVFRSQKAESDSGKYGSGIILGIAEGA